MNEFLYDFTVGIYNLILYLTSSISERSRKIITGRKYWIKYFNETKISEDSKKSVWIHCASLGEFEQGRPVIEAIRNSIPDIGDKWADKRPRELSPKEVLKLIQDYSENSMAS